MMSGMGKTIDVWHFFELGQFVYDRSKFFDIKTDVEDILYESYKSYREKHNQEPARELMRAIEHGWKSLEEIK